VGLSIEEAMQKNHIDGIVLGIEHKGVRKINPSKKTLLRKEDLLILLVYKTST
jgi:Trk K+ transport system NAD-binding subunit